MKGEHDKILVDVLRVRLTKPTYIVQAPAVPADELFISLRSMSTRLKKADGAVLYLLLDGRCYRATVEAL